MRRVLARGLLFIALGMVLGTPTSLAEPPTLDQATAPLPRLDPCLGAAANATESWTGTQVQWRYNGNSTSYTGTPCARYVIDLDVSALQAISGYSTTFKLLAADSLGAPLNLGLLSQPECESLVVDVRFYKRPPNVRALTRFAGGRRHGVWHPEQPSYKCFVENSPGFTEVPWQTIATSGTTRYRIAMSIRTASTVLPVQVRTSRGQGPMIH